jgi:hypothetical protein
MIGGQRTHDGHRPNPLLVAGCRNRAIRQQRPPRVRRGSILTLRVAARLLPPRASLRGAAVGAADHGAVSERAASRRACRMPKAAQNPRRRPWSGSWTADPRVGGPHPEGTTRFGPRGDERRGRNRVWVDGERIETSALLSEGSHIGIGGYELAFHIEAHAIEHPRVVK